MYARRARWIHAWSRLLFSGALFVAGAVALPEPAAAAPRPADEARLRTITVIGRGEASATPDVLSARLGVAIRAPTVAEAMKEATARMTAVIGAIEAAGAADRDIRTSQFSIAFERPPRPREAATEDAPTTEVPGVYRVENQVEVKIRDLSRASAVLDAAVRAGANDVFALSFAVDDASALERRARERAVADAHQRAESLASWSGVCLGPVLSISETPGAGPRPAFAGQALRAAEGPPIEPGELKTTSQVQIVYALVPLDGSSRVR